MRDLQYMIDVMTAARCGKEIQCKAQYKQDQWETLPVGSGGWCWNWSDFDYRIASEPRKPREWVVIADDTKAIGIGPTEGGAIIRLVYKEDVPASAKIVRVREVLPE